MPTYQCSLSIKSPQNYNRLELPVTKKEIIFHLSLYLSLEWVLRPRELRSFPWTDDHCPDDSTPTDQLSSSQCFSSDDAQSAGTFLYIFSGRRGNPLLEALKPLPPTPPSTHNQSLERPNEDSMPQRGGCRPECRDPIVPHPLPVPVTPSQPLCSCWHPPSFSCQQRP